MTRDEAIEHGRAWVAAGWVWAPGQAYIAISRERATLVEIRWVTPADLFHDGHPVNPRWEAVPDLRDRGTLGHALGQVRDAWGDQFLVPSSGYDLRFELWWSINSQERRNADLRACGLGRTEAEALLAARRAAP